MEKVAAATYINRGDHLTEVSTTVNKGLLT